MNEISQWPVVFVSFEMEKEKNQAGKITFHRSSLFKGEKKTQQTKNKPQKL